MANVQLGKENRPLLATCFICKRKADKFLQVKLDGNCAIQLQSVAALLKRAREQKKQQPEVVQLDVQPPIVLDDSNKRPCDLCNQACNGEPKYFILGVACWYKTKQIVRIIAQH